MLNGRQVAWIIFQNFKRNEIEVGMTEFRDLQSIRIKGDNLVAFVNDWDSCLYGMKKEPDLAIQESLFTDQVKQCKHFEQAYAMYVTKCTHDGLETLYEKLRSYVLAHRKAEETQDHLSSHQILRSVRFNRYFSQG